MTPGRRNRVVASLLAALFVAAGVMWVMHARATATDKGAPVVASATSVAAVRPTTERWPQTLQATGAVAAWQEAVIAAEYGGLRIAEIRVDVGSRVKRGQILALLADDALRASLAKQQATVAQAQANLEQARSNVKRGRAAEKGGALSAQTIEGYLATEATSRAALDSAEADLRTTKIQLAQTRIVAVDDGIVSSRSALLGNVVASGAELFRIVRQGRIDWQAELDARQLGQIAIGQAAHLALPTGERVEGKVRLIAPTLSTTTGRAIVYVALDPESGARPGVYASGDIDGPETTALTLPQTAVVLRDGRSDVFVVVTDDSAGGPARATASRRTVVAGRRRGDRVEIVSGLPVDAMVVTSGGAFLSEGRAVEVAAAAPAPSVPSPSSKPPKPSEGVR